MAETRVVRVMESMSVPADRRSETAVFGGQVGFTSTAFTSFERTFRVMQSACREERRAGLFVFAVHDALGLVGRMWLSATDSPRAGTLGRHERVDLALSREEALSLRHLVFVVRQVRGRVRVTAVDLETLNGVHTCAGRQRVTTAEGCLHLRSAAVSFFCVPTGLESPLPGTARLAWTLFDDSGPAGRFSPFRFSRSVGVLRVELGAGVFTHPLDERTLERGVLIGRNDRCDVLVPDPFVSRVHGLIVSVDGAAHLVDTGSSNGVMHSSGVVARCWPLAEGDRFQLGNAWLEWHDVQ
jgi:hypothetical protein